MKQIFTLFFLSLAISLHAGNIEGFAAPTAPSQTFSVNSRDGDRVGVQWINGNGARRIVVAKKAAAVTSLPVNATDYNPSTAFGAGNDIGSGEFVIYDGTGNSASMTNLTANTIYHFAIFEYNGTGSTIEYLATPLQGTASTLPAPGVQPSNFSASNINGHAMTLNWLNGAVTGSGRIVIARANASVNVNPVDLAAYTANSVFQAGTQIGTGNYVIYKGNGSTVNLTGLEPNVTYHFAVFEYNGVNGLVFNTTNPPRISASTLPRPTMPSSALNFLSVEGNRMGISMALGNGGKRLIIAKQGSPVTSVPVDGVVYNGNATFMSGDQISPGEYVLSAGTANSFNVTGLTIGTTYYYAIYEYDGDGATAAYLTSPLTGSQATISGPATQASGISFTNIMSNSLTINWSNGDGAKRLVVMRKDNPVTTLPLNLTFYSASSSFGSGTTFGGGYAVYSNTGNTVNITGLAAGATYHVTIFEYNGTSYPVYLTAGAPTQSVSTTLAPTTPPTSFQFFNVEGNRMNMQWVSGNGNKRLIIARAGSPVSYTPVNNTNYTASTVFASGQQVAPGEYVIFNGNVTNSLLLGGLAINTNYYFAAYEYNAVGANSYFLTDPYLSGNKSTLTAPTLNASNITFSNVNGGSMKVSWASGNGTNRLLIARKGSAVNALPANLSGYTGDSEFGLGAQAGTGNYVVYNGNGNNKVITGLEPGVTYHFTLVEYHGAAYPVYLLSGNATGSQLTAERPYVAASAMNFAEIEGNKIRVKWTNGNGTKRILVAKAGSAVTGTPADGITYATNGIFGTGATIASGEFVVSDNNFAEAIVTGLLPNTIYHFAVFEYDGEGTDRRYMTSSFGTGSQSTAVTPVSQSSNVLFSAITSTSVSVNWTIGSGERRLVVIRKGQPVNAVPQNLQFYSANAAYGNANSLLIPENYAVYNNTGNAVPVSGLASGTTYYFAVFELNGFSGPVYNQTVVATGNVTTLGAPTDPAQNVSFNYIGNPSTVNIRWANGSGQKRLVIVKEDAPVDVVPVNNINYNGNSFFTGGTQIGSGNYVVYAGNADNVTVTNLTPNKLYHVAVFEYNSFPSGNMFLVTNPARAIWAGAPLPVKLISFTGSAAGNKNLLNWSTANELNSKDFTIERSVNGINYTAIAIVNASGNSNTQINYSFEDAQAGSKSFYRLRMADIDGKEEWSAVVMIDRNDIPAAVKLYPSVSASQITLEVIAKKRSTEKIIIADATGRVVGTESISILPGQNTKTINISKLAAGNYFLRIQTDGEMRTGRFIKQ